MFFRLIRTTFRSLRLGGMQTVINVSGLAIACASAALIFGHIRFESNYDTFHPHAERLYQVSWHEVNTPALRHVPTVSPPIAPALLSEFPEVEAALRFRIEERRLVSVGENRFFEDGMVYADPSLFNVLGFKLVEGDPETALSQPESLVLTRSMAHRYFGDADPVGRTVTVDDERTFTVTGIMADLPENTHIRMDFVMPFDAFRVPRGYPVTLDDWQWISFPTFVRLAPDVDPEVFDAKLADFMGRHYPPRTAETVQLQLQPISDVYLNGPTDPAFVLGNPLYLKSLGGIALLILLLSVFNFANLSAAQALRRTREAGVRRVLGASGRHLVARFLMEACCTAWLGILLGIVLLAGASRLFADWAGASEVLLPLARPEGVLLVLAAVLVAGVAAGLYPAVFLSGMDIRNALKGRGSGTGRSPIVRRVLIVAQFSIAAILIIASISVSRQISFMAQADPGFDRESVIAVELEREQLRTTFPSLRAGLESSPNVVSVSASGELFDGHSGSMPMTQEGATPDQVRAMNLYGVDYSFVETMGLTLSRGRSWDRALPADSLEGIIINESAVRYFQATVPEWSDPIGRNLRVDNIMEGRVIGVVADFHYASMHSPIEPLVMIIPRASMDNLLIRITDGNTAGILSDLRRRWNTIAPELPFNFRFMDDHLAAQYNRERMLETMVSIFTALALVIACLGLYGMAAFIFAVRRREIAIRKVLGARLGGLMQLLLRPFVATILIANAIAFPVAWFAVDTWLDDFAYRIQQGGTTFFIASVLTLFIGLVTLAWQTWSTARLDPAQTLSGD